MGDEGFTHVSLDSIRRLCGTTSYATGQTYFKAGRVVSIKRTGPTALVVIQGANFKNYRVSVECSGGTPSGSCTCSRHAQWNEPCKHIAAALFAILEDVQQNDPTAIVQKMIANQLQEVRRRDQNDAILRGVILNYFGDPHLQAVVEKHRGGPDLKVTIFPENSIEMMMTLVIPAKRVPGFLEAVQGRENIFFKGSARNIEIADSRAELEPDEEGTTILRISGAIQKLTPQEVERIKVSRDWLFHQDKFYPIQRKPRLAHG